MCVFSDDHFWQVRWAKPPLLLMTARYACVWSVLVGYPSVKQTHNWSAKTDYLYTVSIGRLQQTHNWSAKTDYLLHMMNKAKFNCIKRQPILFSSFALKDDVVVNTISMYELSSLTGATFVAQQNLYIRFFENCLSPR